MGRDRARTWEAGGALRVHLFGTFEVEGITSTELGSRKARTLLKVLALGRGHAVTVDRLIACCWAEDAPADPPGQVSVLVSRLRGVLGGERILRADGGYLLRADAIDVVTVAELADEADRRLREDSYAAAHTAARAALNLVRGPLLAGEPDGGWVQLERAAADRLVARLRRTTATAALAVGELPEAAELGEQLLEHDPYDEGAARLLMTALAAAGRPASALARYAELRQRLADELGTGPTAETADVHTAILRGMPPPGVPDRGRITGGRRPTRPATAVTLAGRARELEAFDAALRQATARGFHLLELEGEAGIGKSALFDAAAARASGRRALVLRAVCREADRALPLEAILDAIGRHVRTLDPGRANAVLSGNRPLLAPLLGLRGATARPDTGSVFGDDLTGPTMLYAALLGVVEELTAAGPVVLLLDDAHLAGEAVATWLSFSRGRKPSLPLLVMVARRPGEGPSFSPDERLVLGVLDIDAAAAVVGAERAAELHARSGGNPLFLTELAAADPEETLPSSVIEAVSSRLGRAGKAASTLRAAALLGDEVDLDLLAAVTRLDPVELLDHLEEGVRRWLLTERRTTFAFRHELVREALAAGMTAARAALLHREAGRVLADRPHHDPLVVAHHASSGGDSELAATGFAAAAGRAVEQADYPSAEHLLDRSLALADRAETRLARARVRTLRRRLAEAVEDAEIAHRDGGGASALEVAGWASYFSRDFPAAERFARDGADLAGDASTRAACLALAGRTRHAIGDLASAEASLVEALATARGPDVATVSVWLGSLRSHQSRASEAVELLSAGIRLGDRGINVAAALHARLFTAHARALAGDVTHALADLADYAQAVDRLHVPRFAGRAENFRGWILRNVGLDGAADESNLEALATAGVAIPETELAARLDLAEGALLRGELDSAQQHLATAAPLLASEKLVFGWRQRLKARSHQARLAFAAERFDEAEELASRLADDATRLGIPRYALPARLLAVRARSRGGRTIDLDSVGADLAALAHAVALEAWWLTAEVANDLGVHRWRALSEERLAHIIAGTPEADGFRRAASARLDALGR